MKITVFHRYLLSTKLFGLGAVKKYEHLAELKLVSNHDAKCMFYSKNRHRYSRQRTARAPRRRGPPRRRPRAPGLRMASCRDFDSACGRISLARWRGIRSPTLGRECSRSETGDFEVRSDEKCRSLFRTSGHTGMCVNAPWCAYNGHKASRCSRVSPW